MTEQLALIASKLNELLGKTSVAEDEISDPTSTDEYRAAIKLRVSSKIQQLIDALEAVKTGLNA